MKKCMLKSKTKSNVNICDFVSSIFGNISTSGYKRQI
jgi:hypothetical protein